MGNHFLHEILLLYKLSNFSLPFASPKVYTYTLAIYDTCNIHFTVIETSVI